MPPALKEGNSPKLVMVVDRTQDLPMLLRRQSFSHRNNYRIPLKWLFKILKDDAVKVLHSICQQIWKTQQWPQYWKKCFHSNPSERKCQRMLKVLHNCAHHTNSQSNGQNSLSQA